MRQKRNHNLSCYGEGKKIKTQRCDVWHWRLLPKTLKKEENLTIATKTRVPFFFWFHLSLWGVHHSSTGSTSGYRNNNVSEKNPTCNWNCWNYWRRKWINDSLINLINGTIKNSRKSYGVKCCLVRLFQNGAGVFISCITDITSWQSLMKSFSFTAKYIRDDTAAMTALPKTRLKRGKT